jgi:DNA polymerase-3 subunit gamma/tau
LEIVSQTQVLARKWRPRRFSELTGQDHVVRALTNALEQKRLHHAYLFTGTRGIGKTTIARILAKALNCETGVTPEPCGSCITCTEIDAGRFVDLIELDAASNTQVDKMRELLENALYAPTAARYKVYIIDEVHMLSRSAFNAMLKTLEEPPEHVKFILATTDPQKIPVTVLSRCLQFNLKQIPLPLIVSHLKHVLDEERISCDAASLQLLARSAQGSMRDGLSLLDQAIAFGEGKIEEAFVRDMLGAIDQSYLFDLLNALTQKDGPGMLAIADAMETRGLAFEAALQDLATLLHRLALAQIVPSAIGEDTPEREQIFELAKIMASEDVQLLYQIAIQGRDDLSRAPDEYAGFTMTLMRMLAFLPDGDSIGGVGPGGKDDGTSASFSKPKVEGRRENSGAAQTAERRSKSSGQTTGSSSSRLERKVDIRSAGVEPAVGAASTIPGRTVPGRTVAEAEQRSETEATKAIMAGMSTEAVPDNAARDIAGSAGSLRQITSIESFCGDWLEIVGQLKLSGMAKMLAQQCEVKHFSADEIEFCVPDIHRHLLDRAYQHRLQTALREHLGKSVRLKFSVGVGTGMSPAEVENREKQEKQSQAIAAIESDPFVRDLVEHFDAKLIMSSIKPIQ